MKTYDECYFLNYDDYDDILLFEVGCQKCPANYDFGPIVRENFVLHYIIDGCGTLYLNGTAFHLKAGEAFVILPGVPAYYQADESNPWNYIWLHYNGVKAIEIMHSIKISEVSPVFSYGENSNMLKLCLEEILEYHDKELFCIGNMYRFFQYMQEQVMDQNKPCDKIYDPQLNYIKKAIEYIQRKYSEPIRINDIALHCGLNRSYLTKIFKLATGYSPQEYLIHYRITKAKNLLRHNNVQVSYVAYAVGYADPFAFSKMFKNKVGISPCDYYSVNLALKDEQQI